MCSIVYSIAFPRGPILASSSSQWSRHQADSRARTTATTAPTSQASPDPTCPPSPRWRARTRTTSALSASSTTVPAPWPSRGTRSTRRAARRYMRYTYQSIYLSIYLSIDLSIYLSIYLYLHIRVSVYPCTHGPVSMWARGVGGLGRVPLSEQFRKHLYLNMAAPQTFARTFTKPGARLY